MPAGGGDGGGVEQGSGVGQGGTNSAVVGEQGGDQGDDLTDAGEGEFFRRLFEGAHVVAVDGFQGQADVSAFLDERRYLSGFADLEGRVLRSLGDGWQGGHSAKQRPGDLVQVVEVLHCAELLPPVVTGAPKLRPGIDQGFVERILYDDGEVGGGELEQGSILKYPPCRSKSPVRPW